MKAFETFLPSKAKVIAGKDDHNKRSKTSSALHSLDVSWLKSLDNLDLETERTIDRDNSVAYSRGPEWIELSISDFTSYLRPTLSNGLNVETNFVLDNFISQSSTTSEDGQQYLYSLRRNTLVSEDNRLSIGEHDLMWTNTVLYENLKTNLVLWQNALFDAVDRLIMGSVKELTVLGSSALDLNDNLDGAFAPICSFFITDGGVPRCVMLNCSQYIVKRLLQLDLACYRLLEENITKPSISTSTKGYHLLHGSNHIVVEGDYAVNTACHVIAEEVFSFIRKNRPCAYIPPILSTSPLLHGEVDIPRWSATACRSSSLRAWKPSSATLQLLGSDFVQGSANEDGGDIDNTSAASSAVCHKARLNSVLTFRGVVGAITGLMRHAQASRTKTFSSCFPSLLSSYGNVYSRQNKSRLALEKKEQSDTPSVPAPRKFGISKVAAKPISSLPSSEALVNPMVIVTGRKRPSSEVAVTLQETNTVSNDMKRSEERGEEEELWFTLQCRGWSTKWGPILSSPKALCGISSLDESTDVLVETVKEIRWTSTRPDIVRVLCDSRRALRLQSIGRTEAFGIHTDDGAELAPMKPYSEFVDSVF